MSKTLKQIDKYDATPDQLMTMLRDPAYVAAKYAALGDVKTTVVKHESTADGMELEVDRIIPSDMPDFAKKILGDTNHVIQKESWRAAGDGYAADLVIESPGKPVGIKGKMAIKATGDATAQWDDDFDVKASIPLIGGKLEGTVVSSTKASLAKEYEFNKQWLASH